MNRDDFDSVINYAEYWLKEDALRSLDYDVYFSLGTRYSCDAGCDVCYIKDQLKETNSLNVFPDDLEKYHDEWFKFFDYFGVVRTNDDMYYLKYKYPKQYEWYIKYGKHFELCMTDNSIFRTLQLEELQLASIGDISVSTDFISKVGVEKVLTAIKQLYDRYGVRKIKYIDCGHPELFAPIIEWANKLNLHNCVHHDFRTYSREILNHAWAEYQNTWVTHNSNKLVQIYRESIHLYYNRFYYSSDDASDLREADFYKFDDKIDIKYFIFKLIEGKLVKYKNSSNLNLEQKFRNYYKTTQQFIVNENFNFIPIFMFPLTAKFFYKLEEDGWLKTKFGLLLPNEDQSIIPLIQNKPNE